MQDRRQQPRSEASQAMTIYDAASGKPVGQVANISESGIMLISESPFESDKTYHLTFPSKAGSEPNISFEAVCLWTKRVGPTKARLSGFELKGLSRQDRELLECRIAEAYKKADVPPEM
jgi:hypothetical protein